MYFKLPDTTVRKAVERAKKNPEDHLKRSVLDRIFG